MENPIEKLEQLSHTLTEVCKEAPSNKHMNHRELGKLEPSESLKYKASLFAPKIRPLYMTIG